jgi:hypothetical protein
MFCRILLLQTPDAEERMSKRKFASVFNTWRRSLHEYDPDGGANDAQDLPEDAEDAIEVPSARTSRPSLSRSRSGGSVKSTGRQGRVGSALSPLVQKAIQAATKSMATDASTA